MERKWNCTIISPTVEKPIFNRPNFTKQKKYDIHIKFLHLSQLEYYHKSQAMNFPSSRFVPFLGNTESTLKNYYSQCSHDATYRCSHIGRESVVERRRSQQRCTCVFQVARMGVKVPVLSPPPPKDPNHRSSLTPGYCRQRAVRRVEKGGVPSRGGASFATRESIATRRRKMRRNTSWEQRVSSSSSSSSRMLHAARLRQVARTTMGMLDNRSPGLVQLASKTKGRSLVHPPPGGAARTPTRPRLFCPLPPCGRRLVRSSFTAPRSVVALDHDLGAAYNRAGASERACFVREEKSGDLRVYACVYRLYHMDIFEDVPLAMKKRR